MKRELFIVVFIAGTAACADSTTGLESLASVYGLTNTPVALQIVGGAQVTIVADTLYLGGQAATRRVTYRFDTAEGEVEMPVTEHYHVRVGSGRLELDMVCPVNALMLCTPPPHLWGLPSGSGLVLRTQIDPGVPLLYTRVPNNLRIESM